MPVVAPGPTAPEMERCAAACAVHSEPTAPESGMPYGLLALEAFEGVLPAAAPGLAPLS